MTAMESLREKARAARAALRSGKQTGLVELLDELARACWSASDALLEDGVPLNDRHAFRNMWAVTVAEHCRRHTGYVRANAGHAVGMMPPPISEAELVASFRQLTTAVATLVGWL